MMLRRMTMIMTMTCLLVSYGAEQKKPTPAAKIGETIKTFTWEYTVTSVNREKVLRSPNANSLEAKGEWVIVFVTLNNVTKCPQDIHDYNFRLVNTDGNRSYWVHEWSEPRWLYQLARGLAVLLDDRKYDKKSFPPGEIKTALVYDVEPASQHLELILPCGTSVDLGKQSSR